MTVDELRAENAALKAQVAALREALERAQNRLRENYEYKWVCDNAERTLSDTAAAAEAHDAEVRRQERAAERARCVARLKAVKADPYLDPPFIERRRAILAALESK